MIYNPEPAMSTPARRRLMRDFKRYRGRWLRGKGGGGRAGGRRPEGPALPGEEGGSTTWRRGRARSADCVGPVLAACRRVTLFAQGRVATCLGYAKCAGAAAGRGGGVRRGGGAGASALPVTRRLQEDPPAGVSGAPSENNIMVWNAVIFG